MPIVRFNVEAYLRSVTVPQLRPEDVLASLKKGRGPTDPNPTSKGYYYAGWSQTGTFYGAGVALNTWRPSPGVVTGAHSLTELAISGGTGTGLQTIEVGETQDPSLNGGSTWPSLFTFYTTNGYTAKGNNLGGYNAQYTGWVQYSSDAAPGLALGLSSTGGTQLEIELEVMNWYGNYWVWLNSEWIGYYPASLFASTGIGNSAAVTQAFGEVYDPSYPTAVATGMGSGAVASTSWQHAAYIRDYHYFVDSAGSYTSFLPSDGSTFATDSNCYSVGARGGDNSSGSCSGTPGCIYSTWFNYVYYGGPGLGGACH